MSLKVQDATKEELIQYFFLADACGGGARIPEAKDSFLLWLKKKRADELLKAGEAALEASQKALQDYISFVKRANDSNDIEEKINFIGAADSAYKRYKKFQKVYETESKKLESVYE